MSLRIARNAAWNVAGTLASSVVGLVALAILVDKLGADGMGVFTLALGMIGFSGVLDLGLGRALTQKLASDLGAGREKSELAPIVWRVLAFLACIGSIVALILWLVVPAVVAGLFDLRGDLASQAVFGLRMVGLSMPFALASTVAAGALEGLQEFRLVSLRRAMLSIVQFGLPVLAVFLRPDVGWAIGGLAASRVVGTLTWMTSLRDRLPRTGTTNSAGGHYGDIAKFGGWLSISNVVGPLMVYADRFYLASLFPPAAVAYYAVPLDSLFRMTALPATAAAALFPAFAGNRDDAGKSSGMLRISIDLLLAVLLPLAFAGMLLAHPVLNAWLGTDFAEHATVIFKWLVLGMFINSSAHVPFALIQGSGRADITAKLHLLELPPFVVILVAAVAHWGVSGAAVAWTMRVAIDTGLLYFIAMRGQPALRQVLLRGAMWIGIGCLLLAVPLMATNAGLEIAAFAAIIVLVFLAARRVYASWRLREVGVTS